MPWLLDLQTVAHHVSAWLECSARLHGIVFELTFSYRVMDTAHHVVTTGSKEYQHCVVTTAGVEWPKVSRWAVTTVGVDPWNAPSSCVGAEM
jgi:hypothetical protein